MQRALISGPIAVLTLEDGTNRPRARAWCETTATLEESVTAR